MSRMVLDAEHAVLDAAWHEAFDALRAAGVEADADHPVAAAYRTASNAVNHANRSRDFAIATGRPTDRHPVCGFCHAELTVDGRKHLPPWGEHEEPITIKEDQ